MKYNKIRICYKISLLISIKAFHINKLLWPLKISENLRFSNYFRWKIGYVIVSTLFDIRSKIWQNTYCNPKVNMHSQYGSQSQYGQWLLKLLCLSFDFQDHFCSLKAFGVEKCHLRKVFYQLERLLVKLHYYHAHPDNYLLVVWQKASRCKVKMLGGFGFELKVASFAFHSV